MPPPTLSAQVWQFQGAGYWFPMTGLPRNFWLSSDVSATGRILEAYANNGTIRFRFPSAFGTATWSEVDTTITDTYAAVRYLPDNRILIVTQSGATVYRRTTSDEGRNFTVATNVMDGSYPAACISGTGAEVYFCVKSTGAINTKVLSPQGTVVIAEREVVAAGTPSSSPISCFWRYGKAYLVYKNGSGTLVTISSADLLTYS